MGKLGWARRENVDERTPSACRHWDIMTSKQSSERSAQSMYVPFCNFVVPSTLSTKLSAARPLWWAYTASAPSASTLLRILAPSTFNFLDCADTTVTKASAESWSGVWPEKLPMIPSEKKHSTREAVEALSQRRLVSVQEQGPRPLMHKDILSLLESFSLVSSSSVPTQPVDFKFSRHLVGQQERGKETRQILEVGFDENAARQDRQTPL